MLEYYVGHWAITGSLGDVALKDRASFRMPAGKHCIIGTVNCRGKDGPVIFSLVSGWDSTTGWYTEQGLGADGGVYSVIWHKISETADTGEQTEMFEGKKVTSKVRLERKGKDEFAVACTERTAGDEKLPDLRLSYKRVTGKKDKTNK